MKNSEKPNSSQEDQLLILENQVCFPLYSAANAMIRTYRPLLEKIDLTYSQFLVMMVLWQENGISVKTLGEKLHLDSGTLTPLLKRLESKGLVNRERSETDERVRVLNLTEKGKALKIEARKVPQGLHCRVNMDMDELMTLKALCNKLIGVLND